MLTKEHERSASEQDVEHDRATLTLLLKSAVIDMRARSGTFDLDTNEALPRLVPVLCAYFSREELVQLFGEQVTTAIFAMHRTEVLQNLFLERTLQDILRAFNDAGVPLMLFKGPALAYQYYAHPHLRTYHDIDAFIHPEDRARAQEILLGQGFACYEEFRSNAADTTRTGYNYVLKSADSWLEIQVELHTAPHPSEIGTPFNVQDLWKRALPITLLDTPVFTMSHIDHLLYLCWHYRFHGFTRLIWLYDLVMLLRVQQASMDWSALVQQARNQGLATTLYYCLCWCRDLFHVAIPVSVFRQLRPPLLSRLIVERLAMPDTAKALASPRWQARRIIARRAMVDSNADLLGAGLRALFPSRAAIGRRYLSRSRLPLQLYFLFYLIHPIATLGRGLHFLLGKQKK